jgi:hypothetical protein
MVAPNQYHLALLLECDQTVKHLAAVMSLVDQVAQKNQLILRRRNNGFQQRVERVDATMDVANGYQTILKYVHVRRG